MMSNYFSSGNVYVIDDVFEEAKPIINSLYKLQIPHIYSDGSGSSLPELPVQVRLIFLDLNLKPTINPEDKKSFKNLHASILNKLLENNSCSYVVLVWSKEEETLLSDFKSMLLDEDYNLLHRQPLDIIELNKKNYFSQNNDEQGDSTFTWIPGTETQLFELITQKLNENEAFKILSSWETLIRKSGSKTVDSLFELACFNSEKSISINLNQIISNLSISVLGAKNFKLLDNQGKTDGFMLALSELIDDEIDKEIILNTQKPEFTKWVKPNLNDDFICQLNSKLLISKDIRKKELTGSLFVADPARHDFLNLFTESFDISKDGKATHECIKINEGKGKGEKIKIEEYIEKLFIDNSNRKYVIPIEINLTPLCDVVQKKEKYYRLVPGFLLHIDLRDYLLQSTDRNYKSPFLFIEIYHLNYIIILDYRYLYSLTFEELGRLDKLFTLRKNFVDDIQLKLSNHVSRLGVLNL
ncbi:hypothetical protein [Flavobacterium yafengii]|uniref:hypothetical protein n=1 Tax=Flavobacterium yafengii TaxID=3041253 RepID=UPI0024A9B341|nr:hypothetical protein [Flavobacterium yafengii]MDI5889317.1 hypothetical protein [Flavobacterium yafengii]